MKCFLGQVPFSLFSPLLLLEDKRQIDGVMALFALNCIFSTVCLIKCNLFSNVIKCVLSNVISNFYFLAPASAGRQETNVWSRNGLGQVLIKAARQQQTKNCSLQYD